MSAPAAIDPAKASKLLGAIRLLASDKPGDVVNAGSAIERLVGADKPAELVANACKAEAPVSAPSRAPVAGAWAHCRSKPEPVALLKSWQRRARFCLAYPHLVRGTEREFLQDMSVRRCEPTPRQADWLANIAARLESEVWR